MNYSLLRFMDKEEALIYRSIAKPRPDMVLPNLYIGNLSQAKNKEVLNNLQIQSIVQISDSNQPPLYPNDFDYHTVSLPDNNKVGLDDFFFETIRFIKEKMEKGRVLVHCNAGISRSAAVVMGFLIYYNEMNYQEAFDLVKKNRPCINPKERFRKFLIEIEQLSRR